MRLSAICKISVQIPYGLCTSCGFLAPWPELSDDMLLDYYTSYLSDSYKHKRSVCDASYSTIAFLHGSDDEIRLRRAQHTDYIKPILTDYWKELGQNYIRCLDYGGSSGGMAPDLEFLKWDIFDIDSSDKISEDYDFIQCLHVLEHVGNPLKTLMSAYCKCRVGGLFYLEVPNETHAIKTPLSAPLPPCDEHINKFKACSLRQMVAHLGGIVLHQEEAFVETLHTVQPISIHRLLFSRT